MEAQEKEGGKTISMSFEQFLRKFMGEERRVQIPMATKRKVYENANGRCESCGMPLKMKDGEFHHTRKPTVKSRPSTIQFLCGTCHKKYGHERYTITKRIFGMPIEKEPRIKRKRVHRHKSPYWPTARKKKRKKK